MKKIAALSALSLAVLSVSAHAAPETYQIDPTHTFPNFQISHLGFSVQQGRFDKTAGTIVIDRAKGAGSINVTIETASIDTGLPKLEEHLRGADFFNVEKFPTMTFKADKLKFNGEQLVSADGNLTLLGVTRPVTLTVDGFHCGTNPLNKKAACGASVSTTIKRSEFGMSTYVPAVGDEVKITIPVEAYLQ